MASPNFRIAAQLYDPIPLPISSQTSDNSFSIRLISVISQPGEPINCQLWAAPFHGAATAGYFALSYVWGDASITEEITVNGLPFQATRNLVLALKWYSRSEYVSHPIWVDAVCINQCNIPERNDQVQFMGSIYTSCWEALCYLGPDADEKDAKLFHLISALCQDLDHPDMQSENPSLTPLKDSFYSTLVGNLGSVTSLLRAPVFQDRVYWTRVWTFQEAVLSPAAPLIIGDSVCYIQDIERIANWVCSDRIYSIVRSNMVPEGVDAKVWKLVAGVLLDLESDTWLADIILTRKQLQLPNTKPFTRLCSLVVRTAVRNCYDARDKLYGLAGIIDIGIKIDYDSPVAEVYMSFAVNLIGKTDDLCHMFLTNSNGQVDSKFDIPSWVPDYTCTKNFPLGNYHYANQYAPSTAKSILVDGKTVQVRGVVMDAVDDVLPYSPRPTGVTKHSEIWQQSRISTVAQSLLGKDARNILSEVLTAPLYINPKTGIPLLQAVLRLLSEETDIRYGVFSTEPNSTVRPETLPILVDALMADLPDEEPLKQMWDGQHGDVTLEKAKEILRQILDEKRLEDLNLSEVISVARVAHDAQHSARDLEMRRNPFVETPLTVPFHTKTGYIGYGIHGMQKGDLVCVLGSCSLPVVLRMVEKGQYKLISLCHVIGAKNGEVWGWGREVEEFGLV
ncbi:heterokaryon incompatibility protein-domain-containing protein [Triangularia setosa]|uniref:Heterokaryon incompatibility protein-domain-containing protein n=1 Tax=Triangularia setosa TaxID=2587417 RepID=A0AAN6W5L8_9PEZI|nr:heterokaryon incompatibility protein-domain-containing protein [Podospora setosa]